MMGTITERLTLTNYEIMRKKTFILYVILATITSYTFAGDSRIVESLNILPKTVLPYFEGKGNMRSSRYFFNSEALYPIPIYYYNDIGCTEKEMSPMPLGADIFRRYEITHGNYAYLAALEISESDFSHTYLATFDMYGNVIDYLSVDVGFAAHNSIFVKQFEVLDDMSVIVYSLNVQSSKPVYPYPKFDKVRAQRVDTYYKITDSGKFEKQREVTYLSKDYTYAELDNMKNIKEGGERR